jgi:hypothetical protein
MMHVGIPPSLRGRVWQALIGGHLHIAPDMYEDYMKVIHVHVHIRTPIYTVYAHTRPHTPIYVCSAVGALRNSS